MSIGDRIRVERLRQRLTQKDLGERVGVTGQQIQKWESADRIEVHRLLAIAEALGVAAGSLVPELGVPTVPTSGLQPDEQELLAWYRRLGPGHRQRCVGLVQGMALACHEGPALASGS
jgi:transcriptional regulator with XRE-family HTH domain